MILTIFAEQSGTLHFPVTERDVVKVNQNQDAAFFPLIILLLIQLLNSLRLPPPHCFRPAPRMKSFTLTLPFKPKTFLHSWLVQN